MALQCKNPKPDGSWCGVPIEWREIGTKPDGSPKKRPFETDTGEIHNCPYYKKQAFSNFKQTAAKVEQEITSSPSLFKKNDTSGRLAEFETQYASDMKEMNRRVTRAEQAIQALVAELSFKKGTEVKQDRDEEVVQED